jgi:hypothetical protein
MMVRQGVVLVSTRPTQSDAKEYKMNHTLNVWVQRVGCIEERQSKIYKEETRIKDGKIHNTKAHMLLV